MDKSTRELESRIGSAVVSRIRFIIFMGLMVASAGFAQLGGIRGMAIDQDFDVPLPGVKVLISETGQEAVTGDTGSYYLEKVEPGSYTLLFSKGGYSRFTQSDVVVSPGQLAEVEASLAGEYEEMDELVVKEINLGGASEIGLLNLRMESAALMDSVGADLMGKAGASDAAQALALVPGTTVQDGKYAVVRGLPDRYVSTQMNGVRLPTADPDKRAVQLDQFPSAMIESVQVSKTFTPDQQGDASGGAVNVILKGIPDERVLKGGIGFEINTQVLNHHDQFLTYQGGGVGTWGNDANNRQPQAPGAVWTGAVGVQRDEAPLSYKWGVTAGDKYTFDSGLKIGAVGSFFYKRDASYAEGTEDRYWQLNPGENLTPFYSGAGPSAEGELSDEGDTFFTSLYDTTKASEEVQWGAIGGVGIETEDHTVSLLYSYNRTAEDTAVLQENTRGKQYYFPGHDPYDQTSPGHFDADYIEASPFVRSETLSYTERTAETLQLRGTHTLPFPDVGIGEGFRLLNPELDWTVARSSSRLDNPDKRLFSSYWEPPYDRRGTPRGNEHKQISTGSSGSQGNLDRVWRNIEETSDQFFVNGSLPFEQWSGDEGYLKLGIFNDQVERTYLQDSYNSDPDIGGRSYVGDWDQFWSAAYPSQGHVLNEAPVDVNYDGSQEISAWYWMADLPVASFLNFIGGARFESTEIRMDNYPDNNPNLKLYLPPQYSGILFFGNEDAANVDFEQNDVLPSLGFELKPVKKVIFRGNYSETVARQTFKELSPVQQQEYLGADIFIGNPYLGMSNIQNYDLRLDYNPYPGGLLSLSWFYKDITDPIEYQQVLLGSSIPAITAVNYDQGTMNGYEVELRQSMGLFWEGLEGLSLGGNLTLIDSEVTIPDNEQQQLMSVGAPASSRDMLNAPEYLYNLNAVYTVPTFGTELGLFYIVKGDTLVAGGGNNSGNFVPDVYETERATLNFTLSQKLGSHMKVVFKAKNLTDPEIQRVYRSEYIRGEAVRSSYTKGIDYSIDLIATW